MGWYRVFYHSNQFAGEASILVHAWNERDAKVQAFRYLEEPGANVSIDRVEKTYV